MSALNSEMVAAQKAATCARIPPNRIAGLPFVQYNGAFLRCNARATEQESPLGRRM